MKTISTILLSILNIFSSVAQEAFIISGTTNLLSTGKVVLVKNALNSFYSFEVKSDTVDVVRNVFIFEGKIIYPQQFRLVFILPKSSYISKPFFVDTGFQRIIVDTNRNDFNILEFGLTVTNLDSTVNKEFSDNYLPLLNSLNERLNSFLNSQDSCVKIKDEVEKKTCVSNFESERVKLRKSRDSILLFYTNTNPNSPILPWILYSSIKKYGFTDDYQTILNKINKHLLPGIRSSLDSFLTSQKRNSTGMLFPLSSFIDSSISKKYIQENQFTLIEFWFSSCSPCIAQFQLLRSTYKKYHKYGFDIVGISTDGINSIDRYNKILQLNKYPWKQILDLDGKKAKEINIYKYPTNYLIDRNGFIVKIDIDPNSLESFLSQWFKQ